MKVIPVIDLLGGEVVHAQQGQRSSYRPIRSPLCNSSEPLDVVRGYRSLFDFTELYIADLDAIQSTASNEASVRAIRSAFGDLQLWVDNGLATLGDCREWLDKGLGDLVIGSEAQKGAAVLDGLLTHPYAQRVLLSLDFKGETFLGPQALLEDGTAWPGRVIVMTLARVGSGQGPDVDRLDTIIARAGQRQVFAAGGVRDGRDLNQLARRGVSGALVATALHDGRIARSDLEALCTTGQ